MRAEATTAAIPPTSMKPPRTKGNATMPMRGFNTKIMPKIMPNRPKRPAPQPPPKGLNQACRSLEYGQKTDQENEILGYYDGAPQGMSQYQYAGDDAEYAGEELPPPQGGVDEDADESQHAPDQEVEAQDLNQEEQCGPRCY